MGLPQGRGGGHLQHSDQVIRPWYIQCTETRSGSYLGRSFGSHVVGREGWRVNAGPWPRCSASRWGLRPLSPARPVHGPETSTRGRYRIQAD